MNIRWIWTIVGITLALIVLDILEEKCITVNDSDDLQEDGNAQKRNRSIGILIIKNFFLALFIKCAFDVTYYFSGYSVIRMVEWIINTLIMVCVILLIITSFIFATTSDAARHHRYKVVSMILAVLILMMVIIKVAFIGNQALLGIYL